MVSNTYCVVFLLCLSKSCVPNAGADPGSQVIGLERGAKIFGVFRVKNHDFMQKKTYFFPILRVGRAHAPAMCSLLPLRYSFTFI